MIVAHKPLSPQEEKQGQIEWLIDLRDELDAGNIGNVRQAIGAALKLHDRQTQTTIRNGISITMPRWYEDSEECGWCNREIGQPHKPSCRQS